MISIIQGGMGVAVSNYKLANAVSKEGGLGVISGTGIEIIVLARLQEGDVNGDVQRALAHFPDQVIAGKLIEKYYVENGIAKEKPYISLQKWTMDSDKWVQQVNVLCGFVEVWLAKEGHKNPVGINLLEKVFTPNQALLYGAMLAGVDYVIMGAGIPIQVPGILDSFVKHEDTLYKIECKDAEINDQCSLHFKPGWLFTGLKNKTGELKRPKFLPIISSNVLALALLKRATGKIDGFIVETSVAGGHNAPPRGNKVNEKGEPLYGPKDEVNLEKLSQLGLPFWLAGGYGTKDGLEKAKKSGAVGIQVGTAFAYTNESGLRSDAKDSVLKMVAEGGLEFTTSARCSPSGFPFKVVSVKGSLSEKEVYDARTRICDKGHLRHAYKTPDGKIGFRCPAENVDAYLKKGGKIEDTVERRCLCNALVSAAGYHQRRKGDYNEGFIVTSGDDVVNLNIFQKDGKIHYSVKDVIDILKGKSL